MAPRTKIIPQTPVEVPVELLVEDMTQPRQKFDDEQQQGLNESVKAEGIHVPLEVIPIGEGKHQRWKIVKGARRYRAAKHAGLATVPCVLATATTLRQLHRTQLLENTGRADLEPADFGVALYTEYFTDQILALAAAQGDDGAAIVEDLFARIQRPVERMVALRDHTCQRAGVATLSEYLQSGRVRVPWKAVLERVGLSRIGDNQLKKLLTPVKQIEPDVLELLIGSGASTRALTDLGRLPAEEQRAVVEDAHRVAATHDGDIGRALREVLDAQAEPDPPGIAALGAALAGVGAADDIAGADDDQPGDGDGGRPPSLGEERGTTFVPDPSLAFLTGPSGSAPKLVTDRPPPQRGSVPPPGHGAMDADTFLQFTGALEALTQVLDAARGTTLTEAQLREAGALWGEIAERCTALGLEAMV